MLEGLSEYCTEILAEHGCPSVSVVVAERGEVVFAGAYGPADVAGGRPATPGTAYGLGSITKPVTVMPTGGIDHGVMVPGPRRDPGHPSVHPCLRCSTG